MKPTLESARLILAYRKIPIPELEEDIFEKMYELLKEDDFIGAHSFRLRKERKDFTKSDWAEILELSGLSKILSDKPALLACTKHRLI